PLHHRAVAPAGQDLPVRPGAHRRDDPVGRAVDAAPGRSIGDPDLAAPAGRVDLAGRERQHAFEAAHTFGAGAGQALHPVVPDTAGIAPVDLPLHADREHLVAEAGGPADVPRVARASLAGRHVLV